MIKYIENIEQLVCKLIIRNLEILFMLQTLTDGTTALFTWFRLIPAIIFVETIFMDQVSEATCYFPVKTSFPVRNSYIIFFGITILQKLLVRKWYGYMFNYIFLTLYAMIVCNDWLYIEYIIVMDLWFSNLFILEVMCSRIVIIGHIRRQYRWS